MENGGWLNAGWEDNDIPVNEIEERKEEKENQEGTRKEK